ncbi:hypothetical protein AQUCO_00200698v1 [Aquilegia coerulea]|uniref:KIB1-4 beta-propeller domain-containing protein n=1 Tax=Aquilegia coerulea TaxID=218851 RepID=A0A2G5F4C3_AQUCA|nr:hypothetical protein AQUCO_00200698v1 [Aquilegia coerulea]
MEFYDRIPKYMWDLVIFPRLSLKDLIRLGALCHSWRSIAAEIQRYLHPLPWLMISRDVDKQIGTFYSLSEAKTYNLKLPDLVLESYCCGTSQGFLIIANWKNNFIFNPFSQTRIDIPRQYVPPEYESDVLAQIRFYLKKAIILPTPDINTVSQCVVVSGLSSDLAIIEICRSQDPEWAIFGVDKKERVDYESGKELVFYLDSSSDDDEEEEIIIGLEPIRKDDEWSFSDILFYKGMLHGLTQANGLVRFELPHDDLKQPLDYTVLNVRPMSKPTDTRFKDVSSYLVDSCGELLMVYRYSNPCNDAKNIRNVTKKFVVYKLDQSSKPFQWVQLQSLGDQILFLGRSSSMSISAAGVPGFKGNCIYFTDDIWPYFFNGFEPIYRNSDNGVFYLDDGRIESFFNSDESYSFNLAPVWLTPNWISSGK